MRARTRSLALVLVVLATARCGPTSSTKPNQTNSSTATPTAVGTPTGQPATVTIDQTGGTIRSPDGRLTINVPSGAVSTPTEFSVQPITNLAMGGVGGAFRLGPEGLTFQSPVTLVFKGPDTYTLGASIGNLGISYQDAKGYWHPVETVTRDGMANTLTVAATHFSDWGTNWSSGSPAYQGTFTLNQTVRVPFSATGSAALYADASGTSFIMTGTITVPSQIVYGSATCTPDATTVQLPLSVAEFGQSPSVASAFRWGLNAAWDLTCTSSSGASTAFMDTLFDTMQINLPYCPGSYAPGQLLGPSEIKGSYTSDCGIDGTVTATWDFLSCIAGAQCQSSNPCHTAAISCATGTAVCTDTGNEPDGTSCGTNMVCSAGTCVSCTVGAACTPTNVCDTGTMSCTSGPVCTDTGTANAAANGTSCGNNMVCNNGACVACTAGLACTPVNICDIGVTSCSTGTSVCTDTGTANTAANGTICGTNMVCNAGACVCAAGAACTSSNPCHTAAISCATGIPVCTDTGNVTDGTSCGAGQVCSAGSCVAACVANVSCQPANACQIGTTSCDSTLTQTTCNATGNVANGTSCGSGQVCSAGQCVAACVANVSCQPANPCQTGTTSCDSTLTQTTCNATGNVADGTSCGVGQVCSAGQCVAACVPSQPCQTTNPCQTGTTSCDPTLTQTTCNATGTVADGTSCGSGQVCSAGTCIGACVPGQPCQLQTPNPCETGTTSCDATLTQTTCNATNVADGTSCGQGFVCSAGSCITACVAGQTCYPTECTIGTTSCDATLTQTTCNTTGNEPDGTTCTNTSGATSTCLSGVCQ